jgi:hypothetical protein
VNAVDTCPWGGLTHVPSPFCEEPLCSWVREPANTWSNLGFLIAGLVILARARHDRALHLRGLGWICIATALGSSFYHASESRIGQIFDWAGMYLGAVYMLSVNVRRLFRWGASAIRALFWLGFVGLASIMIAAPGAASALYTVQTTFCCVALELALFFRYRRVTRYACLAGYWSVFLVAYTLWILDAKRVLCNPTNHVMNGHAAWHLLDAAALYLMYRYYRQFDVLRAATAP